MNVNKLLKRIFFSLVMGLLLAAAGGGSVSWAGEAAVRATEAAPLKIKALILPKFEIGEMSGDFPGEAQYYYEAYFKEAKEYTGRALQPGHKLYVNSDGLALYVLGAGKVNAAMKTGGILLDERFDFSEAYVISTGCAGGAYGYGVMGDVFVISETVDYDLGHRADIRDLADKEQKVTWYPMEHYVDNTHHALNTELVGKVYELVKDTKLDTTEKTMHFMKEGFAGEDWAGRTPQVLRGSSVTADNYWKGIHDHYNAEAVCQYYKCRDPFATSEMEDNAIACVLSKFGLLDRYIIIRDVVDMDVFTNGNSPEHLWGGAEKSLNETDNLESADIFATAMNNNFRVGKVIIEAILQGKL